MSELRTLLIELIREVAVDIINDVKSDKKSIQTDTQLSTSPIPKNAISIESGVLTEKQILAMADQAISTVRVTKSVVITPLARDTAKSKNIRIEKTKRN